MPQPTREQIEAALERLPESQHAGFLAEVKRRMQPPRSMAPGRGSSFADISAWRQNTMGDLGRSEPQTPEEAYSGGRGASVALATTAAIAAPVAVAKMMGRGATAYAVEEGVDLGAQAVGVSPYWSDKAADAAGILSFIGPGGLVRFISRLGGKKAKKELKEKLVQVVVKSEKEKLRASAALRAQGYTSKQIDEAVVMGAPKIPTKLATSTAPPVAPKAPAPSATTIVGGRAGKATSDDVAESVLRWKNTEKFSDAQVVASLREVYGIPAKEARALVKMLAPKAATTVPAKAATTVAAKATTSKADDLLLAATRTNGPAISSSQLGATADTVSAKIVNTAARNHPGGHVQGALSVGRTQITPQPGGNITKEALRAALDETKRVAQKIEAGTASLADRVAWMRAYRPFREEAVREIKGGASKFAENEATVLRLIKGLK